MSARSTEVPRIFVGSSTEGRAVAERMAEALTGFGEVVGWWSAFPLGMGYLEALCRNLEQFDFAVLVATGDDIVISRERSLPGPRDNILFELGLFMGRLGRDRTAFVHPRSIKIPSDLAGVETAAFDGLAAHGVEGAQASIDAAAEKIVDHFAALWRAEEARRQETELKGFWLYRVFNQTTGNRLYGWFRIAEKKGLLTIEEGNTWYYDVPPEHSLTRANWRSKVCVFEGDALTSLVRVTTTSAGEAVLPANDYTAVLELNASRDDQGRICRLTGKFTDLGDSHVNRGHIFAQRTGLLDPVAVAAAAFEKLGRSASET